MPVEYISITWAHSSAGVFQHTFEQFVEEHLSHRSANL